MQVTLCIHRALTAEDVAALPAYFHTDPATDLAGGPVEIIYETEEGLLSTRAVPCARADSARPLESAAVDSGDCGACPPCGARAAAVTP